MDLSMKNSNQHPAQPRSGVLDCPLRGAGLLVFDLGLASLRCAVRKLEGSPPKGGPRY